ncbi:CMP-N-acetylneuraminic acid synthetase [Desulfocapsa sulfexigens DSM 10523]|uniref:CMP-N-acetylneuraminic acid synthetase n=1 Tax=Desulfocapsa sulfexigens (strain DSM 10523 / SB164P1) TaxID=1167006 RepID=M1PDH6_DESSD|nr:acylneuraminate cytidylyltransferase family protein [Desulfocapsa sulfexigens]AGF79647.1 CMP-N-acetylneuraminic acid synthetase [Desulfocapsa sulfexigens DSM 10523]
MYKQKKILALITARGGSKGILKKNIKLLGDKPLICWTIEAALHSQYIDRLILSSDDFEIIEIAKMANCEVPFTRPKYLAEDETSSMDVIMHALEQIEEEYDYLLLLQPTSPFRTTQQIDNIIATCLDEECGMMISVARLKKHPMFMYRLNGQYLESLMDTQQQLRRQDMPAAYEHNGALYLAEIDLLKRVKSYTIPEAYAFIMTGVANLDIDDQEDWQYAEFLIEKGQV